MRRAGKAMTVPRRREGRKGTLADTSKLLYGNAKQTRVACLQRVWFESLRGDSEAFLFRRCSVRARHEAG